MINYYKTADSHKVALILSEKLNYRLTRGRVLWLVGGGSVIKIAIEIAKILNAQKNLNNLTVTLTDERFGPVGHHNSNWQQLSDLNFMLRSANMMPVLLGGNLYDTVSAYTDVLNIELINSGYTVALGGIGADGHIFGIKPHSQAVNAPQLVVGYKGSDYIRVTPTGQLVKKLDEIILYAVGAEKHHQLDRIEDEIPAEEQPAQLLKQAKLVSIYNDYKGEKL